MTDEVGASNAGPAARMTGAQRFLAACARRPVDRTPVWMMRQAGRYLPEYRAVRERVDFLTLCKTPELASQVSLQPIERFGMDACVIFSDILVVPEAMGARVAFGDGGPKIAAPVRTLADVDSLRVPDMARALDFVCEALRLTRAALGDRAALVGFCGAPFTLASYLVEGGGSTHFEELKRLMFGAPAVVHALLAKLADACCDYVAAQVAAGAQAVQIFDTWAGMLAPHDFAQFAAPYQAAVVRRVRACGVPVILYVNGCAGVLEQMRDTGADVLSVDWRIELRDARRRAGDGVALQGNVDPVVLLTTPSAVRSAAHAALRSAGEVGHILNLGHGILPHTPIECARAFVEAPARAPAVAP